MKTSDDIERLRAAERQAQEIIAHATHEVQRIRSETETHVARLKHETEEALISIRESMRAEEQKDIDALVKDFHARLALARQNVSHGLETGKSDAVRLVVGELKKL